MADPGIRPDGIEKNGGKRTYPILWTMIRSEERKRVLKRESERLGTRRGKWLGR